MRGALAELVAYKLGTSLLCPTGSREIGKKQAHQEEPSVTKRRFHDAWSCLIVLGLAGT